MRSWTLTRVKQSPGPNHQNGQQTIILWTYHISKWSSNNECNKLTYQIDQKTIIIWIYHILSKINDQQTMNVWNCHISNLSTNNDYMNQSHIIKMISKQWMYETHILSNLSINNNYMNLSHIKMINKHLMYETHIISTWSKSNDYMNYHNDQQTMIIWTIIMINKQWLKYERQNLWLSVSQRHDTCDWSNSSTETWPLILTKHV